MNWTTEQPTAPGYYWVRVPMPFDVSVAFVGMKSESHHEPQIVKAPGCDLLFDCAGLLWAGPIVPPEITYEPS